MFTISRNSGSARGMTDKRDWRIKGIPFNRELLLISRSVTGRRQRLNCGKIDGGPVAFLCRRVRIGSPRNFSNSDYSLFRRRYDRRGLHRPVAFCEDYFAQRNCARQSS